MIPGMDSLSEGFPGGLFTHRQRCLRIWPIKGKKEEDSSLVITSN
jgi:hypothetical protein